MASSKKATMKVIFGAMSFGQKSIAPHCRVTDIDTGKDILEILQKHGHNEIDTARRYGNGTSETMLGDLQCQERGLLIGTKYLPAIPGYPNPKTSIPDGWNPDRPFDPAMLRLVLQKSLAELQIPKLHVYYPCTDPSVPTTDYLKSIDALHKEGLFTHFGLTNYSAWKVALISEVCDRYGWVKPTVFQGKYNMFHRTVESDLIPCLRHYNIAFYAFNPVAGGFLAGGESFERNQNGMYGDERYHAAITRLAPIMDKHNLTLRECALRWMRHHSLLDVEKGDAVLMGASSAGRLEENLLDMEKGPLPEDVVKALDEVWEDLRAVSHKQLF